MLRSATAAMAAFLICLLFVHPAHAADMGHGAHATSAARVDDHAPIGVMPDHVHNAGEWMFSYRMMLMDMQGNLDGRSDRSRAEVLAAYPIAPTEMSMTMHMLGAMYAPSDTLTLMAMLPWTRLEMDHVRRVGAPFTTKSQGIGDMTLSALFNLSHRENSRLHAGLGISIPTGSINAKDDTPAGRSHLPYPMQLGSGTPDLKPSLTFSDRSGEYSWGAQGSATLRFRQNRNDYQLGNRAELTSWLARRWFQPLSTSIRLTGSAWGNIHGSDSRLNPNLVPTADPDRRAGRRLDIGLGANYLVLSGPLSGHRLGIEFGKPVIQWLDGPQLETDWILTLGWQKAF